MPGVFSEYSGLMPPALKGVRTVASSAVRTPSTRTATFVTALLQLCSPSLCNSSTHSKPGKRIRGQDFEM